MKRRMLEVALVSLTTSFFRLQDSYHEINPLAGRRHFKFLVAPDVLEVGASKNFGNVPVPKVIGFFRRIWIGLQIKIFVRGRRTGNTVLLRRACANLGAVLGIGLAVWIRIHIGRHSAAPERRGHVSVERLVVSSPDAASGFVCSE